MFSAFSRASHRLSVGPNPALARYFATLSRKNSTGASAVLNLSPVQANLLSHRVFARAQSTAVLDGPGAEKAAAFKRIPTVREGMAASPNNVKTSWPPERPEHANMVWDNPGRHLGKPECKGHTDYRNMSVSGWFFRAWPLVWCNPYALLFLTCSVWRASIAWEKEPSQENAKGAKTIIAAVRQSRRESLKDFKEFTAQRPGADKREYDEQTWRGRNHTTLVKTNSFRPGGKEAQEKIEQSKAYQKMQESKRTGLYDSEGLSDSSRESKSGQEYHREAFVRRMSARPEGYANALPAVPAGEVLQA